jgi:hypothetical protein
MGNLIELATFRRNETTMEVTILKKTRTTRMTRIHMGRVAQIRVYSENGDRSVVSTQSHNMNSGEDTFKSRRRLV